MSDTPPPGVNRNPPPARTPPPAPPPTPNITLYTPDILLYGATPEQLKQIGLLQLRYAKDVSELTAAAYIEVLAVLAARSGPE